jgi:hypothetical protein
VTEAVIPHGGSAAQNEPGSPPPAADSDESGLDFAADSEASCRREHARRRDGAAALVAEFADAEDPLSASGSRPAVVVLRTRWRQVANRSRFATLAALVLGAYPATAEIAETGPWTAPEKEP